MTIYKLIYIQKGEGLLASNRNIVHYSIYAKDAEIVAGMSDARYYNRLYAIPNDTEKMALSELLNIVFHLKTEEVKEIIKQESWLEPLFLQFISNPWCNDDFRKEITDLSKNAKDASDSSCLSASYGLWNFFN